MKFASFVLSTAVLNVFFSSVVFACPQESLIASKEAESWAEQTLSKLPLENKVAQLVFIHIAGGYMAEQDPRLQEWVRFVHEGVGALCLYGGTPRDVAALLNRLQKETSLPRLMEANFEGGPGSE